MSKFNVGDRVVCTNSTVGLYLVKNSEYTVLFTGKDYVSIVESGEEWWCDSRFELVEPSLSSLYEIELDKLVAQQSACHKAWELVESEKLLEQSTRKAIIHAKQVEVGCVRDRYLQVCNELDEMLRNEHL
jgi:hypothetical protein